MKLSWIVAVAGLLTCFAASRADAQQQAEYTPSYLALIEEAEREFRRDNLDAALAVLKRADAVMKDTAVALNMRGAIATQQQDYEAAREYFERAVAKAPDSFPAQFNLGEVLFLQRRYEAARKHFQKMLEIHPKNELLVYKIYFTYLMEEDKENAKEWLDKIKSPTDSPAYYFARAAWDFKNGNPEDGRSWVREATRTFTGAKNRYYMESLSDMGWVARVVGE
jgi:tetratricopeptide (TPR) repeat protein